MISLFASGAAARGSAAVTTTTWNPSDKAANITLSNGNLTFAAAASGADLALRAVASATTGKKYWEVHADALTTAASALAQGVANASHSLSVFVGGDNNNSMGWAGDGKVYKFSAVIATIQTWTSGSTLCFAYDIGADLIFFRTDAGNWNNNAAADPATGANGITAGLSLATRFAAGHCKAIGDTFTANFGGSAYAQAVPSGFGNW